MIKTSAPGRICLFGEHQDYLHLPVITSAIDLRIGIEGNPIPEKKIVLDLPDIGGQETFRLPEEGTDIPYVLERDYFRSAFNVARRFGVKVEQGWKCRVHGEIPINSGTSSSSALIVAWVRFLTKISAVQKEEFSDPAFIGKIAYLAEVEEFGEPGGMMDQYATAVGGVLFQDFSEQVRLEKFSPTLGTFVLGDSRQAKDTKGILKRVKFGVLQAIEKIKHKEAAFDLKTVNKIEIERYASLLTKDEFDVLQGAVLNRDFTREALKLFQAPTFDAHRFGVLMNAHQEVLAMLLKISTPKIDNMLQAALKAGAYGGKINGSGGGGCMFVYAPENPQAVAEAIEREGGKAYIIQTASGVDVQPEEGKK